MRDALHFFKQVLRKALGGGTGRHIAQHTQVHAARRDGERCCKLTDLAARKLALDKFARDARDAEADLRKVDKKAPRAELDLGRELDAALKKVLFQIRARGGFALEQDEREGGDLLRCVGMGKVAGIVRRGDKSGVSLQAWDVL